MEKEYGIEHEQEVLAAFDKMNEDFKNAGSAAEGEAAGGSASDELKILSFTESLDLISGGEYSSIKGDIKDLEPKAEEETSEPQAEEGETEAEDDTGAAVPVFAAAAVAGRAAKRSSSPGFFKKKKENSGDGDMAEKKNKKEKKNGDDKQPKEKKERKGVKKILFRALIAVLAVCVAAGLAVVYYVGKIIIESPEINPTNFYEMLAENSQLLDSDGNLIQNIYSSDGLRSNIEFNQLPENLKNAFVCIEDKTFFDHHGFNFVRIVGAIWQKVSGQSDKIGGTSTITQQLARNLYLTSVKGERSMERKIREAYYTVLIEHALTKEQILEAYMNTIYLGYNCNGIQAAAEAYFSKDVSELSLMECACLASLPQSPNVYAPIKRIETSSVVNFDTLDIISKDSDWTVYFNDASSDRIKLVLWYMHDQGKISDEEYETAKAESIRDYINPGTNALSTTANSSYFVDYVVSKVLSDIQNDLGYSYQDAYDLLYRGGLTIKSTINMEIQGIMDSVYADTKNFPDVGSYRKDKDGNVLYPEGSRILLYSRNTYFQKDTGNFVLKPDEYQWLSSGDLMLLKDKRLNFYKTSVQGNTDYSVEFKGFYEIIDKEFYSYSGGSWSIPASYKNRDDSGNLIISASYFTDKPDNFTRNTDGTITVSSGLFSIPQGVLQPQSAMVIMDHTCGQLVAMIGGRGIEGRLLYNRATSTRQPGSSIKPLAVYGVALQAGKDGLGNFTAATALDDAPIKQGGSLWPHNWYSGYTGITNLRHAVEQSINACAVQLYLQLDPNSCIEKLQSMGISSLVTEGDVNDINASALALGGMTRGISPLEMTAAYGTFGNYGVYVEPMCYTEVVNKRGDVILSNQPITHQVFDEDVASLMTDILRTTVTNGLASGAKLKTSESAGKTGTTSEKYDIWFCGLTPKYSAAVWIGNDVNISLKQGSSSAAAVWKKVMEPVCGLDEDYKRFEMKGDFVNATVDRFSGKLLGAYSSLDPRGSGISELFISGTVPGEVDTSHVIVRVCAETGYLATSECEHTLNKLGIVRPNGKSWEKTAAEWGFSGARNYVGDANYDAPEYYCPIHNPNRSKYPVPPGGYTEANYNPVNLIPEGGEEPTGPAISDPDTEPVDPQPGDPGVHDPGTAHDPEVENPGGDIPTPENPETPPGHQEPGTDQPENPENPENPQEGGDYEPADNPNTLFDGEEGNETVDEDGETIYNW